MLEMGCFILNMFMLPMEHFILSTRPENSLSWELLIPLVLLNPPPRNRNPTLLTLLSKIIAITLRKWADRIWGP